MTHPLEAAGAPSVEGVVARKTPVVGMLIGGVFIAALVGGAALALSYGMSGPLAARGSAGLAFFALTALAFYAGCSAVLNGSLAMENDRLRRALALSSQPESPTP